MIIVYTHICIYIIHTHTIKIKYTEKITIPTPMSSNALKVQNVYKHNGVKTKARARQKHQIAFLKATRTPIHIK